MSEYKNSAEHICPVTVWDVPFNDTDILYSGKEAERIQTVLSTPGENAVYIQGPYGSGKTYLAKYYSQKYRHRYPDGIRYYSNFLAFDQFLKTYHETEMTNQRELIIADEMTQFLYESQQTTEQFLARFIRFKKEHSNTHIIMIGHTACNKLLHHCRLVEMSPVDYRNIYDTVTKYLPDACLCNANLHSFVSDIQANSEGNPRKLMTILTLFHHGDSLSSHKIITLPGIIDAQGKPLKSDHDTFQSIKTELACANHQVVAYCSEHPEAMYEMSGLEFEHFIASVLNKLGYQTTVTPPTNDGGVDIYAAKKEHLGSFLFLVQCKNNKAQNPVGINVIRELYGVLNQQNATFASVFTTSYFSKPAIEFQKQFSHQLSLHDYNSIVSILKQLSESSS